MKNLAIKVKNKEQYEIASKWLCERYDYEMSSFSLEYDPDENIVGAYVDELLTYGEDALDENDQLLDFDLFAFMMDIEVPEEIIEVTLEDIAEKFGCPVENLRIKE